MFEPPINAQLLLHIIGCNLINFLGIDLIQNVQPKNVEIRTKDKTIKQYYNYYTGLASVSMANQMQKCSFVTRGIAIMPSEAIPSFGLMQMHLKDIIKNEQVIHI